MSLNEAFQFLITSPLQLMLTCFVAFSASILAGLSGYGTGLILPVFVVPLVGVTNVIPVMAVAMLLNNGSRVIAFWQEIQWLHVRHILVLGLPACIAGAYSYTLLSADWITLLLGSFLLASVLLRRILRNAQLRFSTTTELGAGAAFGFINGGMTGTGAILISMLMSVGINGSALVATDAVISVTLGIAKIILFGSFAVLNLELALMGLLIGLCTAPGAFVARVMLKHIPAGIHAWFMELVVIAGAIALLLRV
ncbi:sulfite exporter TauE/SafE family protein [Nitrosomonas sp. Nm33]|uniref:sulfite exporter TauE/SafE family protein n=1 Tax=Nitrosomonas sp. Nm33 TaxID=133724 RepID=UPI0008982E21|nr:sulfite exporter TauE/SafE family protein [Nitrosomonas sp. Nm33]SDY47921.1 Sulfite exporter TauE/SafE [Nitrosomonas sp. Nm33]